MENYRDYITEGKGRSDLTKLFANQKVFSSVIEDMSKPFLGAKIDRVVGLDALRFIFAARVAEKLNVGLVLARKSGKLSVPSQQISFTDYTKTNKSFEIANNAINSGEKILIVDEWSETGSQLKAAIKLVESMKGTVVGVSCFNIDNAVYKDIELSKYKLYSVIKN